MKRIGFLSFGHWGDVPGSRVGTAREALLQAIDLAMAAEEAGLARFGRSYIGEPERLVQELSGDAAVAVGGQ